MPRDSVPSGMPKIVFHADEDSVVNHVNEAQVIGASLGSGWLPRFGRGAVLGSSFT